MHSQIEFGHKLSSSYHDISISYDSIPRQYYCDETRQCDTTDAYVRSLIQFAITLNFNHKRKLNLKHF